MIPPRCNTKLSRIISTSTRPNLFRLYLSLTNSKKKIKRNGKEEEKEEEQKGEKEMQR